MKYLIPFLLIMACGAKFEPRETFAAPDVNGKPSYLVKIPVQDQLAPQSLTSFDKQWILETMVCSNGFQETKIEYAPFSDDGISTKNITFYCL